MKKEFNISGSCYPDLHYTMDNSYKLAYIFDLIEKGKYFTINRPRQYGKTTSLQFITEKLNSQNTYLPLSLSFELASKQATEKGFAKMFLRQMIKAIKRLHPELSGFLQTAVPEVIDMESLSDTITDFIHESKRKVVLLIDEVDSSSNYEPFLAFLAMLRYKYLDRRSPENATFHSIVLAGVHDVKSLKYKLKNPEDAKNNSPWNIAADFEMDMAFNPKEIAPMLEQYSQEEGVEMDIPAIAERLYYHTSGYPFLVSKLCHNIVDKILKVRPNQKEWILEDVDASVQLMLKENNTNFDSLIKNLENNEELYDLVYEVLIEGSIIPFSPYEPITQLGRMYGIFKENGRLKIHNRIYEQIIYNYMASKTLRQYFRDNKIRFGDTAYVKPDNTLDLEAVLRKFQAFMKVQRSEKDASFIERQWRLVFLAFLQPIMNGKGHDFKEVEISEEKRLDIIVTYFHHKYILELKLWRGQKKHKEGLDQLVGYLDINSLEKGYLIIFDNRKKKSWDSEWVSHKGKKVFAVWV